MLRCTGAETRSTFCVKYETSQPRELLLAVSRSAPGTLGAQIEGQLRSRIRDGVLRAGTALPSTRDLARQLGISRRVVVDAYGQLTAEGYLEVRQGARPVVAAPAVGAAPEPAAPAPGPAEPRFDFRPSMPDVTTFPRAAWARCLRRAATSISDADLGYGDPRGVEALRAALAGYLGRVRGVVAAPENVVVTTGYTQGLAIVCRALAETTGARRIALETPADPEYAMIARRAGLEPVPVAVDLDGLRVDLLEQAGADAVAITPAHQHPTGAVLSSERRSELVRWLRDRGGVAVEDDYDAEYRYDRAAVGAVQGLEPDRVVYAGSTAKTLAPALRLGWLVVPSALVEAVMTEKLLADRGTSRIEQLAFAEFLTGGHLDRHRRRMRLRYAARRAALIDALAAELPGARVRGIAAGLHVTVELPRGAAEAAVRVEAAERRIALASTSDYGEPSGPPTLMLGYGHLPEAAVRPAVRELAAAVRAAAGHPG
jgi:GntR family transcriptional regulator / MocR family aminotransferase